MYFRENDIIVEGLRGTDGGGEKCGCNMPSWIIILIIVLLLIIVSFFIYSIKKDKKN